MVLALTSTLPLLNLSFTKLKNIERGPFEQKGT